MERLLENITCHIGVRIQFDRTCLLVSSFAWSDDLLFSDLAKVVDLYAYDISKLYSLKRLGRKSSIFHNNLESAQPERGCGIVSVETFCCYRLWLVCLFKDINLRIKTRFKMVLVTNILSVINSESSIVCSTKNTFALSMSCMRQYPHGLSINIKLIK